MAYMEHVRSLQLPEKQGYFAVTFFASLGFQLLSYFINSICFNWILLTARQQPLAHGATASLMLIVCCVGSTITGACGQLVNEANVESSRIYDAPHVWEILRDYALHALLAVVTTLVAMAITRVFVARGMIGNRQMLPAIPIPVPAPAPAMQAIQAAVQPLPVMPAVQAPGDNIDDVLARAPIPTRLNSPLSWL